VHTHARLLHDCCTTCTDTDIDRYRHTHIHIHKHTYTHTHIHTHTHTHTYTYTTHTHIHTHTTHTHHTHTPHTHTTQEAANYVSAEVRRVARSGELHCSTSASCHKQRRTTFMRTQGHGKQRKWRPPLRRLHLRCKVATLEARVRVLHNTT
jgi:hypothetical protein